MSTSASHIYLITLQGSAKTGYKIKVLSLDPLTGKEHDRQTLSSDADISEPESILYVGANVASPIIGWTDKANKLLKVNILGSKHIHAFPIPEHRGEDILKVSIHAPHLVTSLPHFLVHYESARAHWAEVYHIDLSASSISNAYTLPRIAGKGTFSVSNEDANVFFVRNTESETLLFSSATHGILERWAVSLPMRQGKEGKKRDGVPSHAACETVPASGSSHAVRCALTLTTGDWMLIRNGERTWHRPEALAGAVAAEWADPSNGEGLAEELHLDSHENALTAYVHRLRRHARDLAALPAWLRSRYNRITSAAGTGAQPAASETSIRMDSYGFHKLVIVATENGRIYGLDAGAHGRIVWAVQGMEIAAGDRWDVKLILVDAGKGKFSVRGGKGDVFVGEILTGKAVYGLKAGATPRVRETVICEIGGTKYMLDVLENGRPVDVPESAFSLSGKTVVVRDPSGGGVKGFRFVSKEEVQKPVEAWQFVPASRERVAAVTTRPLHDPVASIGRVLGDRSVMYKYLNPNSLLVTVVNDAASTASFHLLDSVTGEIVQSSTRAGVDTSKAISSVMSENWFVYTFWGEGASSVDGGGGGGGGRAYKGYQLAVSELYESPLPNDRGASSDGGNYSSLEPSSSSSSSSSSSHHVQPHVMTQSFFVPEELVPLAVTQTRQGITSRNILAALPRSNAIVALPRAVVDARRPLGRDPSPAEQEEGLARRTAVLELDPKWIVTHRRDVAGLGLGLGRVIASPSALESTSLVFAYGGLDLFGTRLAPSLAFDMLGKEFARAQLVLTVLALGVGVAFLAPLVRWSLSFFFLFYSLFNFKFLLNPNPAAHFSFLNHQACGFLFNINPMAFLFQHQLYGLVSFHRLLWPFSLLDEGNSQLIDERWADWKIFA